MTALCGSSFSQGSSELTFPNNSGGNEDFVLETLAGWADDSHLDELIKVKKTKTRCFLHLNIGLYALFCQLYCQLLVSFSWGKNQFLKSLNLSAFFDELCPHSCYLAQMSTKTAAPAPTVSASEWHTVLEDSIPEGFARYTGFARELLQQSLGKSTKWSSLLAHT